MDPNVVFPLLSSLLSFVFALFLLDQWIERRRPRAAACGVHRGGDAGALRRFVNIYVGDEDVRFAQGLDTPIPAGTECFGPAAFGRISKSKISVGMASVQQAFGMSTTPEMWP